MALLELSPITSGLANSLLQSQDTRNDADSTSEQTTAEDNSITEIVNGGERSTAPTEPEQPATTQVAAPDTPAPPSGVENLINSNAIAGAPPADDTGGRPSASDGDRPSITPVASTEAAVRAAVFRDPLGGDAAEARARAEAQAVANDLELQGLIYSISKPVQAPAVDAIEGTEVAKEEAADDLRNEASAAATSRFEEGLTIIRGEA